MSARLDHITVVAPDLDSGADYVERAIGVRPGPGRSHPNMATHNVLLSLGPDAYLEVIAVDPGADPVARPRWFGLDSIRREQKPRLAAWVAGTDDIEGATVPELGAIEVMRRDVHTWKMTVRADGSVPLDGAAPLLIQRAPGVRPAAALSDRGLRLLGLRVRHPDPDAVRALFARIGLASEPEVTVTRGGRCALVAEIRTPDGLRLLGEG